MKYSRQNINQQILITWRQYAIGQENFKESTINQYRRYICYLIDYSQKDISGINYADILHYLVHLSEEKKDLNTRGLQNAAIRSFFRWYSKSTGDINPAADLRPIQKKYTDFNMITPGGLIKLILYSLKRIESAQSEKDRFRWFRNSAMLVFLADTGVRIEELISLRVYDISIDRNKFIVNVPAIKTARERRFAFGELSDRNLVGEVFASYWLMRTQTMKSLPNEPLFPKVNEYPIMKPYATVRNIQDTFERIGKKLNIKMNPHAFRHFYGTYSVANGMNLKVLQHNLGHSSLSTTEKYVHLGERIRDENLQHQPTAGLKTPNSFLGFSRIARELYNTKKE